MTQTKRRKRILRWSALSLTILVVIVVALTYFFGPFTLRRGAKSDDPAPQARWPWPQAVQDNPHPGVIHWLDRSAPDGTVVELFDFDFHANPSLRLEMYDLDEDDRVPFDDKADYWPQGVGQVTRHLNAIGRGPVVAAWNGLFFQFTHVGPRGIGSHVAPVVLRGQGHYNVGVVRWAVGVKYTPAGPRFAVLHRPDYQTLVRTYDFAAEGASCLIYQGRPLRLEPFPRPGEPPFPPSKPPTLDEAGFVRLVDHIRTSRTSMGWSKDNRHFYLLIVKEPESEAADIYAFARQIPLLGGWTTTDTQRFWQQFGAWCAVNLDGGDVTQLAVRRPDGRYDLVPARWADRRMRRNLSPDLDGAPTGGTMMYFYVRDKATRERNR
ncbi:MAG: phosphodiester glycosidase family protein [Armatimonadota bacterium]